MSIIKFPRNHNNKSPHKRKYMQGIRWSNWQAFERKGKKRKLLRTNRTSFPGFFPTRPYGARRTTDRREDLGTRSLEKEKEGDRHFLFIFTTKRREWVCSSNCGAWVFNAVQITYKVQHHN